MFVLIHERMFKCRYHTLHRRFQVPVHRPAEWLVWRNCQTRLADPDQSALDPYERLGMFNGKDGGSIAYYNWFAYEFWRFMFVQQQVALAAQSFIDFPPMQGGASFNMPLLRSRLKKRLLHARSVSSEDR